MAGKPRREEGEVEKVNFRSKKFLEKFLEKRAYYEPFMRKRDNEGSRRKEKNNERISNLGDN